MIAIVFSEGKNDTYFAGEVFNREMSGFYEREFNAEEDVNSGSPVPQESRVVNNFVRVRRGERAVLLKSEQGEDQLMNSLVRFLLEQDGVIFSTIVDLDGGSVRDKINEIENLVDNRTPNAVTQVNLEEEGTRSTNEDFQSIQWKVVIDGQPIENFGMVAFYEDLEDAAEIDGSEPRTSQEQQIERYLDNNPSHTRQAAAVLI